MHLPDTITLTVCSTLNRTAVRRHLPSVTRARSPTARHARRHHPPDKLAPYSLIAPSSHHETSAYDGTSQRRPRRQRPAQARILNERENSPVAQSASSVLDPRKQAPGAPRPPSAAGTTSERAHATPRVRPRPTAPAHRAKYHSLTLQNHDRPQPARPRMSPRRRGTGPHQ